MKKISAMKNNSILITTFLISISGFLLFGSCEKRKLNREIVTTQDNTIANNTFDDIYNTFEKFDDTEKEIALKSEEDLKDTCFQHPNFECLTICIQYVNIQNWERIITLDFGASGCKIGDGRERKGKIIAHRKGRFRQQGSTSIYTTENYSIDNRKVEGIRSVTNIGRNSANQLQFSVEVEGTITFEDGKKMEWDASRVNTWLEGSNTWVFGTLNDDGSIDEIQWLGLDGIYDDVWEISGTATGVNRNGRAFTSSIFTPLLVQWCSPFIEITKGKVVVEPEDLTPRMVDFGDGDCDNEATVTINNRTHTFNLR